MKLCVTFSIIALLLGNLSSSSAFVTSSRYLGVCKAFSSSSFTSSSIVRMSEESATPPATPEPPKAPASKGFGKKVEKVVEEEVKDAGTLKYERDMKRGVPEFNIFMRPANGEKEDWVSHGALHSLQHKHSI